MTANDAEPSPADFGSVTERIALQPNLQEQRFWAALALAILLHAGLLVYASHAMKRIVGEAEGVNDPIAVSILTEDEYRQATGTTQPSPATPELKQTLPADGEPEKQKSEDSAKPEEPPADFKTETVVEEPAKPAEKPASDVPQSIVADNPDLFKLPDLAAAAAPAKSEAKPKPVPAAKPQEKANAKAQKLAKLDLQVPSPNSAASSASSPSASFTRPPGITRSGENDAFGRGVLAAMQRAMPPGDGQRFAVVLRTILDQNGNVVSIEFLGGDPKASLTGQLIFAMRTATYPFPPRPSSVADRTFEVRYLWR